MKHIKKITIKQHNFILLAIREIHGKGRGPNVVTIGKCEIKVSKLKNKTMSREEASAIIDEIKETSGLKPEKKIPKEGIYYVERDGVLWLEIA